MQGTGVRKRKWWDGLRGVMLVFDRSLCRRVISASAESQMPF